jgi:hypothetical protein
MIWKISGMTFAADLAAATFGRGGDASRQIWSAVGAVGLPPRQGGDFPSSAAQHPFTLTSL